MFSYEMKVTDSIKYVGVNDHEIDLFEGQFEVPLGMAYNSYVIMDEQIAVMDSVDQNFGENGLRISPRPLATSNPLTWWSTTWKWTIPQTSNCLWKSIPPQRSSLPRWPSP